MASAMLVLFHGACPPRSRVHGGGGCARAISHCRAAVVDASQPAAFSRIVFAKLRTSACGAVSVSGGLAALLVTLCAAPPKPARTDCAEHGGVRARRWRARGGGMRATINFALHAYLALAVCFLLLRVDRRFGDPGAAAAPDILR